jgi:prepilin-type N-terminal cleavage/methylation domain-containing protein
VLRTGVVGRGFSLIEAMVVVAMLAVLAGLAVPVFLPEVKKAQLDGAAEAVASFIHTARADAINQHRCVRVRIRRVQPPSLVAELLNTFDCDGATAFNPADVQNPTNAPRVEASKPVWVQLRSLDLSGPQLRVDFSPAPSDSDVGGEAAGSVAADGPELRFRPTGRVYSRNLVVDDDDAVLRLAHATLPAGQDFKSVLVEAHGMMCVLPRGVTPSAGANPNDLRCP